jgi:tripartite-type tricarboxylate transporter receptor subunit TctC
MSASRVCAALLLMAGAASAPSAPYPERPIRYIVPSAAGGGADISARLLTAELAKQWKQQIVIDNRPSSGGLIGMELLVRARPDGYTLGYGNMVYLAINPALVPQLPYNVDRDVQPVGQFTSGMNLLAVRTSLPVRSVRELVDYARSNPGKLSFGSSGNGTTMQLSGELFKQMTGTSMVHIPYKAVQQALTELIAGQIDLIFDNQPSVGPHVTAGRLRGIAVTGPKRSTAFPDLPTVAEAGIPGYEITTWTAMIAPVGMPKAIVAQLNAGIQKACATPELVAKLAASGQTCAAAPTEEFVRFVKTEQVKWGGIVRRSGAKID